MELVTEESQADLRTELQREHSRLLANTAKLKEMMAGEGLDVEISTDDRELLRTAETLIRSIAAP
jgi:hypothetical protein